MWIIKQANLSLSLNYSTKKIKQWQSPKLRKLLKEGFEPFAADRLGEEEEEEDLEIIKYDIWLKKNG